MTKTKRCENKPLPLGTKTKWGKIAAVGNKDGERYYMMMDKYKCVTLMPAGIIEGNGRPK